MCLAEIKEAEKCVIKNIDCGKKNKRRKSLLDAEMVNESKAERR